MCCVLLPPYKWTGFFWLIIGIKSVCFEHKNEIYSCVQDENFPTQRGAVIS